MGELNVGSYRDLIVWRKSMALVAEVYRIIEKLPKTENYSLSEQLRRAVISIPSNIAEGYGRGAAKDYSRFLNIARGSKNEVETQLQICELLGYVDRKQIETAMALCDEIARMLNALLLKLNKH